MASRRKRRPFRVYNVHALDVWGNERDGYEVNDIYPSQGRVTFYNDATNTEIVSAMKRGGFIRPGIHTRSIQIEGDEEIVYLNVARTGKPVFELRAVSYP